MIDRSISRNRFEEKMTKLGAWYTSVLSRSKKIPTLKRVLSDDGDTRPVTPEEAVVLSAQFADMKARMMRGR